MALVNEPVPDPFVVLLLAVVGFAVVDQHTPRAVTALPPSKIAFPPPVPPVEPMPVIGVAVVTVGTMPIRKVAPDATANVPFNLTVTPFNDTSAPVPTVVVDPEAFATTSAGP
jgi:hypothetical protein